MWVVEDQLYEAQNEKGEKESDVRTGYTVAGKRKHIDKVIETRITGAARNGHVRSLRALKESCVLQETEPRVARDG